MLSLNPSVVRGNRDSEAGGNFLLGPPTSLSLRFNHQDDSSHGEIITLANAHVK